MTKKYRLFKAYHNVYSNSTVKLPRFISKLDSIGVVYRYSDDMLDEFMRLESVVAQIKREEREAEKEQDKKIEPKSRSL